MSKKMLIDATHSEETRVVVLENGRVEELDVDTSTKKQIKGNIYLAKVVRVEPSLQAAFIDYGGNKHGFLAFGEIHPDYYQIPVADREALKEMMSARDEEETEKDDVSAESNGKKTDVEVVSESATEETPRQRSYFYKKYKIQEVIRQGQVMLVQVVKEERGNKGAALTTYLSLAGRFSVLMPNNGKGGGVSRKITNVKDRKSLRAIVEKLPIPEGMSVIIRTAGQGKTKTEIKRDYDYLIKTWMKIREITLESLAPKLIHEEGDIVKRSLRDVFTPDIEEIWIEGESVFKSAKEFMKILMPAQAKKIKQYKGIEPLFLANQVENQLEAIHSNIVQLKSGGYLVIDQTEALVAVDVNSGRATREHDIEETALRTNLETCEELARQLRLRDLAGLIVIDFIDMDEPKNNAAIERKLKEALKRDRARIQVGKMSGFGLMEMSRQRLHSSFLESSYKICPCCGGKGLTRSVESCAMHALHILEEACVRNQEAQIVISLPLDVATYILNNKRLNLVEIEKKYGSSVTVLTDETLEKMSDYKLERIRMDGEHIGLSLQNMSRTASDKSDKEDKKKKKVDNAKPNDKNEKTKRGSVNQIMSEVNVAEDESVSESDNAQEADIAENNGKRSRNNRRNEWRKRRKERRLSARLARLAEGGEVLAEMETAKPEVEAEEHFTVVEQQALSEYNDETAQADVASASAGEVEKTETPTLEPTDRRPEGKKKRPFKNRRSARKNQNKALSSSETNESDDESKPAIVASSERIELTAENAREANASMVARVEETTQSDEGAHAPRRKKGWWNKLVNTEEA